jgi:hypothetical protein
MAVFCHVQLSGLIKIQNGPTHIHLCVKAAPESTLLAAAPMADQAKPSHKERLFNSFRRHLLK